MSAKRDLRKEISTTAFGKHLDYYYKYDKQINSKLCVNKHPR